MDGMVLHGMKKHLNLSFMVIAVGDHLAYISEEGRGGYHQNRNK
jgi:hypothetical protein